MQRNLTNETKKVSIEQEIKITKEAILDEVKWYRDLNDTNDVKNAFVVFRSMEGKERLIQAYTQSRVSLCCTACCCCCVDKKTYKRKLFHGKWLKVEQAVEPSLIIWENLGFTAQARCCRITFATIISLLLLFATTLLILYVKI